MGEPAKASNKQVSVTRDEHKRVSHLNAESKIRQVYSDFENKRYSDTQPFSVGHVERRMRDFANVNGIEIAKGDLYFTAKQLGHARRDSKVADGLAVNVNDIAKFPSNRRKMDLYFDKRDRIFVYTDYVNKFIVHPNYKVKIRRNKTKKVNFVTATKMTNASEFGDSQKYVKI